MSPDEFNAFLRTYFFPFLQRAFAVLEPGMKLTAAEYLHVLCHTLQNVSRGRTRRLIVNMPPRHLKSIVCSVVWVAWMLARDPSKKIAIVCHGQRLADELASKCKRLIESEWYRQFAPHVVIRSVPNQLRDFSTTADGRVYAGSIEGGITGTGFNVIILDDPQSANDLSDVELQKSIALFNGSLSSRLNDQGKDVILLVQQRLHEADLSGHLLEHAAWTHLCMPLVASEPATYETEEGVWERPAGHILNPDRMSEEVVRGIQLQNGPGIWLTQWQQSPMAVSGELIQPEQIKRIASLPPSATRLSVSVDTATKALPTSSYTVFMLIASDGWNHYIINVIRAQMTTTQMRETAMRLFTDHRIDRFLIEDTASGHGLHDALRELGRNTTLVSPGGQNKVSRLESCLHYFADGRIFVVGDTPWTEILRDELLRFPRAKNDDQVDALTNYLRDITSGGPPPFTAPGNPNGGGGRPKRQVRLERDADLRPRGRPWFRR